MFNSVQIWTHYANSNRWRFDGTIILYCSFRKGWQKGNFASWLLCAKIYPWIQGPLSWTFCGNISTRKWLVFERIEVYNLIVWVFACVVGLLYILFTRTRIFQLISIVNVYLFIFSLTNFRLTILSLETHSVFKLKMIYLTAVEW